MKPHEETSKIIACDSVKEELLVHMRVVAKIRSICTGEVQIDGVMDDTEGMSWIVGYIDSEIG